MRQVGGAFYEIKIYDIKEPARNLRVQKEIPLDDEIHVTNITSHHITWMKLTLLCFGAKEQSKQLHSKGVALEYFGITWQYQFGLVYWGYLRLIYSLPFHTRKWMVLDWAYGACFNQRCLFVEVIDGWN